jgi:hypothetical protein
VSVSKVKELFLEATNAKILFGRDDQYAVKKLRDAYALSHDLNDQIWQFIPAYRLAHILFRNAKEESDFQEIIKLLEHSEESGSSYVSIHSGYLKFVALSRLKTLGMKNLEEQQRSCLDTIASQITHLIDFERDIDAWSKPVQSDYFNILEYLVYAAGLDHDPMVGRGYDDRNTLFPGRSNDVWRLFGPRGTVDEFTYDFELGQLELKRCAEEACAICFFVHGKGIETRRGFNSPLQVYPRYDA